MDIFENFCRTCGNECAEAVDIFDDKANVLNGGFSIPTMLNACLPASLPAINKDDDYPQQICRICTKKLELVYEFHQKWLKANGEFNVALKFEQRRKRSRNSLAQVQSVVPKKEVEPKPLLVLNAEANGNKAQKNVAKESIEYTVMTVDADGKTISTDSVATTTKDKEASKNTMVFKIESNEDNPTPTLNHVASFNELDNGFELIAMKQKIKAVRTTGSKHGKPNYSCVICTERFHTLKALSLHRKLLHRKVDVIENG